MLVLGHTPCGAITGPLTTLCWAISRDSWPESNRRYQQRSLRAINRKNPAYVDAVARTNVELMLDNSRRRRPALADLEKKGSIKITVSMHDLATGAAEFDKLPLFVSCDR